MDATVSPIPTRTITFEVTPEEARNVVGWLRDALSVQINTPYSSERIRKIQYAFAEVANGEEKRR